MASGHLLNPANTAASGNAHLSPVADDLQHTSPVIKSHIYLNLLLFKIISKPAMAPMKSIPMDNRNIERNQSLSKYDEIRASLEAKGFTNIDAILPTTSNMVLFNFVSAFAELFLPTRYCVS